MLECSALQVCVVTGFGGDFQAMNQADEPHLKNLPGLDKTPPMSFIVFAWKKKEGKKWCWWYSILVFPEGKKSNKDCTFKNEESMNFSHPPTQTKSLNLDNDNPTPSQNRQEIDTKDRQENKHSLTLFSLFQNLFLVPGAVCWIAGCLIRRLWFLLEWLN